MKATSPDGYLESVNVYKTLENAIGAFMKDDLQYIKRIIHDRAMSSIVVNSRSDYNLESPSAINSGIPIPFDLEEVTRFVKIFGFIGAESHYSDFYVYFFEFTLYQREDEH